MRAQAVQNGGAKDLRCIPGFRRSKAKLRKPHLFMGLSLATYV